MSNFTGYTRGNSLAREMRQRNEREAPLTHTGATSCVHGVLFVDGQRHNCPACAVIRAEAASKAEAARASLVAEAQQASAKNYEEGIPLSRTDVVEVETCDDDGKWVYVSVDEFLKVAPEARLVVGRNRVFASRDNNFGLNYR